MIDEKDADGRLRREFDRLGGSVDNILKIHGLNPASLAGHFDLYRTLMRGRSPLSRAQREMIAVTVSAVNQCHY